MDQMRKKLSDAEMEHTKAVNKVYISICTYKCDVLTCIIIVQLNHDLTDLEQLLEARVRTVNHWILNAYILIVHIPRSIKRYDALRWSVALAHLLLGRIGGRNPTAQI